MPELCRNGLHDTSLPGARRYRGDGYWQCRECYRAATRRYQRGNGRSVQNEANRRYYQTPKGQKARFYDGLRQVAAAHAAAQEER